MPTPGIRQEEHEHRGRFIYESDGLLVGEMTYSRVSPTLIIIDHTEVSGEVKGQGIGRRLLDALVTWARASGTKVMATCPYALAQFARDASIRDVLT